MDNNTFIIDLGNRHEYTIVIRATEHELMELGKKYNRIYNLLYQWDEGEYAPYIEYMMTALSSFIARGGVKNAEESDDRK